MKVIKLTELGHSTKVAIFVNKIEAFAPIGSEGEEVTQGSQVHTEGHVFNVKESIFEIEEMINDVAYGKIGVASTNPPPVTTPPKKSTRKRVTKDGTIVETNDLNTDEA